MEELELTYLVKEWPLGFRGAEAKEMIDIYLPAASSSAALRVRKAGEKYEITKKQIVSEDDFSRHIETTIPLTEAEYADLATLPGRRIEKTRYYFNENGVSYEIDVFKGALAGLVLADVEFDSVEKKAVFKMPAWCLADVTQEKFVAGGRLCGKAYADIADDLARFAYQKLVLEK